MAVTLLEAAKQVQDVLTRGVIRTFVEESPILAVLPFETIPGNALKYNQEQALPGVGFRGVNEAYAESTGVLNPVVEQLAIAGGDIDVDKFIVDTMGAEQRSTQEAMKIKALAHKWTSVFIKGDTTVNPKEFDGLQRRVTGTQLLAAGATDGGDALKLSLLDELLDKVESRTHLVMSMAMRRRLTVASRVATVGGQITFTQDQFGRQVAQYNGIPIIEADANGMAYATLDFTEVGSGGATATATSIYCVALGDGLLQGLQNGGIMARDMGEMETKPVFRTRVEWYTSIVPWHPRCAARLWGIKDLAVVA